MSHQQETREKLADMVERADDAHCPCRTWGIWMTAQMQTIPDHCWAQYMQESFAHLIHYITGWQQQLATSQHAQQNWQNWQQPQQSQSSQQSLPSTSQQNCQNWSQQSQHHQQSQQLHMMQVATPQPSA